jgi:hypothetical protein
MGLLWRVHPGRTCTSGKAYPLDMAHEALSGLRLRACPETQVGCSWCDWLCRARRRLMMMTIDQ